MRRTAPPLTVERHEATPTLDEVRRRLNLLARRLDEAARFHDTGRATLPGDRDFPEGTVTIRMSHTLARVWATELRRCGRAVEKAAR